MAVLLLSLGCTIPTDPPIVEQTWQLPFAEVELLQEEFLPAGVSIDSVANAYDVEIDPFTTGESLGNLCPLCLLLPDTIAVTVPAYEGDFSVTEDLPEDVLAVDIESGSISITIDNDLSFDPIEGGGSVSIRVSGANGGATLTTFLLDSATDSLPSGSSTTHVLSLSPGAIEGGIEVFADVVSVGGQTAFIDNNARVRVRAVVDTLLVRSATVLVDGRSVDLSPRSIDTSDMNQSLIDAVRGGTVLMDVTNPFGIGFVGSFTIGTVTKSLTLPDQPVSTVEIPLTEAELRTFLGTNAVFEGSGMLVGGPVVVTPDLTLVIEPTVEVDLEVGGA